MKISVIIPVLNEAGYIAACLRPLQPLRAAGHEVIVVDGGSTDATAAVASGLCDRFLGSERGRAAQMNHGAVAATGDLLVFLHADTVVSADPAHDLAVVAGERVWGCFTLVLSARSWWYRIYAFSINLRTRLTGTVTGDQVLFMSRTLFEEIGGFQAIPLMEDVAMSRSLGGFCAPLQLPQRVTTSSRRWEQGGLFRTMLRMWLLRARYALGADPAELAKYYE